MPITQSKPKEPQLLPGENPVSAGMGHNKPPIGEQIRADFRAGMIEKLATYEQRIEDLVAGANRAVIDTELAAGKSADLVKSIRAMISAISDTHSTIKAPYLEAGRIVDDQAKALSSRLYDALEHLESLQTAFVRKLEEERKAQEKAAREAAKAQEPEVQPSVEPQRAPRPLRSVDTGAAVTSKREKQCVVEDYALAAAQLLEDEDDLLIEAIDKAVQRRIKSGARKFPGVKVSYETKAVTR